MTSARERIFAEIETRLLTVTGVQRVERMPSGDPDKFPALAIYDLGQDTVETEAFATRYALAVTIEGYVEGSSGPVAHAALSDLHAGVVAKLITEPPIGGLAEIIDEGAVRIDVAELASKRRLAFAADFTVQFVTPRGDPA